MAFNVVVFPDAVSFLTKEANLVEKLKSSGALISENAKLCGVLSVDYGSDLTKLRSMVLDRLNSQGYNLSLPEFISTIEPLEKLFAKDSGHYLFLRPCVSGV